MQNNARTWSIFIVALVVVIAVVGLWLLGPWGSNAAAAGLEGKTWRLVSINGQPVIPNSQAMVKFEGGKLSGNSSVNSIGGSYQVRGTTLTLSDLASTLMASADPALNQQETAMLGILQGQLSFTVNGNQLELASAQGKLTFSA